MSAMILYSMVWTQRNQSRSVMYVMDEMDALRIVLEGFVVS